MDVRIDGTPPPSVLRGKGESGRSNAYPKTARPTRLSVLCAISSIVSRWMTPVASSTSFLQTPKSCHNLLSGNKPRGLGRTHLVRLSDERSRKISPLRVPERLDDQVTLASMLGVLDEQHAAKRKQRASAWTLLREIDLWNGRPDERRAHRAPDDAVTENRAE
jgi:hypothetical protein